MMVLASITDKGDINLKHSSPKGLRVNSNEYLDALKAANKPEME